MNRKAMWISFLMMLQLMALIASMARAENLLPSEIAQGNEEAAHIQDTFRQAFREMWNSDDIKASCRYDKGPPIGHGEYGVYCDVVMTKTRQPKDYLKFKVQVGEASRYLANKYGKPFYFVSTAGGGPLAAYENDSQWGFMIHSYWPK